VARPKTAGRRSAAPKPDPRFHFDRRAGRLADEIERGGKADDLLTSDELADLLGVTRQWTWLTRTNGTGPPATRPFPEVVRYRRGNAVRWLRDRARLRAAMRERRLIENLKKQRKSENDVTNTQTV
jgi:hypothetical protein